MNLKLKSRNPERISSILAELENTWKRYPDLRLGQLIMDIIPDDNLRFYIEDDKMLEAIKACRKEGYSVHNIGKSVCFHSLF